MRFRSTLAGALLVLAAAAVPPPGAAADSPPEEPRQPRRGSPVLELRATLSADFLAPGPPSGRLSTPANGRTPPYDGQVIPGFSGMIDNGDGTFWAMPDNGFGAKGNSGDFLLRLYHITPQWESATGGPGRIDVGEFISLRDPESLIPFPIVNATTPDRLLTGDDFDIESVVRLDDGTFWIGEEFGPFLLHVDATGRVLAPPVPFPGGKSPQNPTLTPGEVPRVRQSRGFEAMAVSAERTIPLPDRRGLLHRRPSPAPAVHLRVRPPAARVHGAHLAIRDRRRRQRDRRRLHDGSGSHGGDRA